MRQNLIIVLLGILMSFVLFDQGERVNLETTRFGQLLLNCRAANFEYENCFVKRDEQIRKAYGEPYKEMESRKNQQKIFLIIPCVVLIVSLFVGFAAQGNERYLTLLALAPLFLSFLRFYPYAPEKWLTPIYLLFAAALACLISALKRIYFPAK